MNIRKLVFSCLGCIFFSSTLTQCRYDSDEDHNRWSREQGGEAPQEQKDEPKQNSFDWDVYVMPRNFHQEEIESEQGGDGDAEEAAW